MRHWTESYCFVQARDRIVDNHDIVCKVGGLIDRSEEEGQSERIAIACAECVSERWLPACRYGVHWNRVCGHVIDDDVIRAGGPTSYVRRGNVIQPEACCESLEVSIDAGLICGKHHLPMLIES